MNPAASALVNSLFCDSSPQTPGRDIMMLWGVFQKCIVIVCRV